MTTSALPPIPDRESGEPRPPQAPTIGIPGAGDSETDERHRPKPPPGQGPVLEWYLGSWRQVRFVVIVWPLVMGTVLTAGAGAFWWVGEWWAWLFVILPVGLFGWYEKVRNMSAGADWLVMNRKWVRTYELVAVNVTPAGIKYDLELKDTEGRWMHASMPNLQSNPALWALVYNGILHSAHAREIKTNDRTRRWLHLPPHPPPTEAQRGVVPSLDDLPVSHRKGRRRRR